MAAECPDVRTGTLDRRDQAGHSRPPAIRPRPHPGHRDPERLVHGGVRARSATGCSTSWLRGQAHLVRPGRQDRRLPLGRVPHGAAPGQQPGEPGPHRGGPRGGRRTRARPRRAPAPGGGAGPRQRRPRPPRGLLPRFAGDAARAGDRLRHPLRVRHLRPGDPRRLAGRGHRQVAAPGQPVGDPPLRDRLHGRRGRPSPSATTTPTAGCACAGSREASSGRRLRHAGRRLPLGHDQHPAPVALRGGGVVRFPGLQRRATTSAPSRTRSPPRR